MVASLSDRLAKKIVDELPNILCILCFTYWHDILAYLWNQSFSHMHFASDSLLTSLQTYLFPHPHSLDNFTFTCTLNICITHLQTCKQTYTLTCTSHPHLQLHMHTYNCKLSQHIILCNCQMSCQVYLTHILHLYTHLYCTFSI